jgi:hypothetical protein
MASLLKSKLSFLFLKIERAKLRNFLLPFPHPRPDQRYKRKWNLPTVETVVNGD